MFASLKSEFKKLLTVRSTYIITALVLLFIAFMSIYVFGYQQGTDASKIVSDPKLMMSALYVLFNVLATFAAVVVILLITHEYRYNLINYTLTASKSRLTVFANKLIVALAYSIVVGLVVTAITYFGVKLGVSLKGNTLAPQELPVLDLLWKYGSYLLGTVLFAAFIAFLVRGVVGAIVAFFIFPVVEQMLSLVLKDNADYLPFKALDAIGNSGISGAVAAPMSNLTSLVALGVVAVYLVVVGAVTAVLFIRRDSSAS